MRRFLAVLLSLAMGAGLWANPKEWHDNKFSMFIHFGLYSELGGVWQGRQITYGYSEQIQSHAGIYSDLYEEVADRFNPTRFNADEIVALAKEAGMRSIVITSKHHDGFCLFKTATTDFNVVDATPFRRDIIGELSEACRRGGIAFGLYYSIVDWHMPEAAPITNHNATFVTEPHHRFNLAQVKELVTNYGPISELWFDMGSNTPQQSKELYDLVHRYQPDCMVSGRLGNGYYDFAVMGDNYYPDESIQTEWQSCASMFDETWGYRSWQQRGDVHEKAVEKLKSLIRVVSNGGNFLLNIGPMGTGEVVPFEREVLQEIGRWTHKHADALYGVEASPFYQVFTWGNITRKGNRLYLILTGKKPELNRIQLPLKGYTVKHTNGPVSAVKRQSDGLLLTLTDEAYSGEVEVVELTMDKPVQPQLHVLNGRTPTYSYDNWDYYTNYRSTISYSWKVKRSNFLLTYTAQEAGTDIDFRTGDTSTTVRLADGQAFPLEGTDRLVWGKRYFCGPAHGGFDAPLTLQCDSTRAPRRNLQWALTDRDEQTIDSRPFKSYYLMQEVYAPCEQDVLVDIASGNGVGVYLNGTLLMKHLNSYRCLHRDEQVLLHLRPGRNQIVLHVYNRFEKTTCYKLRPSAQQVVYRQRVTLPVAKGTHPVVTVRRRGLATPHADTELHNLRLTAF